MPGEFDRYNMQRLVSLTANIDGERPGPGRARRSRRRSSAAGDAAQGGAGRRPRPGHADATRCSAGSAIGLAMSVVVILLLLTAYFQSLRLALVAVATRPGGAGRRGRWPCSLTGTTLNLQSFMGAIMAVGVAVANAILLVTFAERSRAGRAVAPARPRSTGRADRAAADPDDQLRDDRRHGADGPRPGRGRRADRPAGPGGDRRPGRRDLATLFVLPAVFALVMGGAGRESASLDPFDPESRHFVREARDEHLALAVGAAGDRPRSRPDEVGGGAGRAGTSRRGHSRSAIGTEDPRSHALRGNAVFDAPRRLLGPRLKPMGRSRYRFGASPSPTS